MSSTDSAEDRREQPNILLIMGDEHGARYTGASGHDIVRTPHLDSLAADGVLFENAYCNSPICGPSRAALLTAKLPHTVGAYDLASTLGSDEVTYAHAVRTVGYDAVLAGKQHFVGLDQLHGFREQLAEDVHVNDNPLFEWPDDKPVEQRWPYPVQAGPGRSEIIDADDLTEASAMAYLRSREPGRPWLLCASFVAPHWPYSCPQEYWDEYADLDLDVPEVDEQELSRQHPVVQRMRTRLGLSHFSDDEKVRSRTAYYGMITQLDERVGRLLGWLEETGQADNTLVVYTSDHGGMLGEHGLWRKMNFYDDSVRVPLLMRWPAVLPAGRRVRENVSLVDVGATVVASAGARFPTAVDGRDLTALAVEGCPGWADEAFSVYTAHGVARPIAMLRRGDWKLNQYLGEGTELFHLATDPGELVDLAGDPAHADVHAEMLQRLGELWDGEQVEARVLASQQERLFIRQALADGAPWRAVPGEESTSGAPRATATADRASMPG